jgi:stachydrine N-demethylase, reductase component
MTDIKPWDSNSEKLACTMVLQDSPDVKTFCFQTEHPSWFRYSAGQFVSLQVEIDGQPHTRCYTLSSSPSRPVCLTITVKAEPGGKVSNWLHHNLKVGDSVQARGPSGIFSVAHRPAAKYLFLAGGVGITPLMSMTRWLFDLGRHTDVSFIQCARTPADLLFRSELEAISARVAEFRVALVVERPNPYGAWTGYSGRLNQLMLELICPDYFEREVFCCGPEPYMTAVRSILQAAGFDMRRYHEESFQVPVHVEAETRQHADVQVDAGSHATVRFAASGREISCPGSQTVLDAAREAGLAIPSACLFGVCGACKVRKLEGSVHMVHNGGITDDDVADGWVLACCTRPVGDVVLDC